MNSIYLKQQNDKNKSFHLCLKYGEYYLLNEEYENALREFAQATRLYPESKRVNTLRIITRMLMKEPCNRNFEIQNFEEIKLSNDFYLSSELIDLINRKMMAKN